MPQRAMPARRAVVIWILLSLAFLLLAGLEPDLRWERFITAVRLLRLTVRVTPIGTVTANVNDNPVVRLEIVGLSTGPVTVTMGRDSIEPALLQNTVFGTTGAPHEIGHAAGQPTPPVAGGNPTVAVCTVESYMRGSVAQN